MKETTKKSLKKFPQFDKKDYNKCIDKFYQHILSKFPESKKAKLSVINIALRCEMEKEFIRPTCWKILLGLLPTSEDHSITLKNWFQETMEQRQNYKKEIKKIQTQTKFKIDPLSANNLTKKDKGWEKYNEDNDLRHLISIDVIRTNQDNELFLNNIIQQIENNVLYIFAKQNGKVCYKQGMNEILAMLIYAIYPFYKANSNPKVEYTEETINIWLSDLKKYSREIYDFFHDEQEMEADLFYMMKNVMALGVNRFFEDPVVVNKEIQKNHLSKRCMAIDIKLRNQNPSLFTHFSRIEMDTEIVIQRWLKCMFTREFCAKDAAAIWDVIFADESVKKSGCLIYCDYFCVAMFDYISKDLKSKDQNECFKRIFNYPPLDSMLELITLADEIKQSAEVKLKLDEDERKEKMKRLQKQQQGQQMNISFVPNQTPLGVNNMGMNFSNNLMNNMGNMGNMGNNFGNNVNIPVQPLPPMKNMAQPVVAQNNNNNTQAIIQQNIQNNSIVNSNLQENNIMPNMMQSNYIINNNFPNMPAVLMNTQTPPPKKEINIKNLIFELKTTVMKYQGNFTKPEVQRITEIFDILNENIK